MAIISESGIYASSNSCDVVFVDESNQPKTIAKLEDDVLEQLVRCDGKAYLVTKNKHIMTYVVGPEGVESKIDVSPLKVTYDACCSPDGQFVVICGREGGTAYLSKGKLLTVFVQEEDKKSEIPIFLSNNMYSVFSTYNPNNTIRKSLHFLKWRTGTHIQNRIRVSQDHGEVKELKASTDGKYVAVQFEDGDVKIYKTRDGKLLNSNTIMGSFSAQDWGLIFFSKDNRKLFVSLADADGYSKIQVVHLPPQADFIDVTPEAGKKKKNYTLQVDEEEKEEE